MDRSSVFDQNQFRDRFYLVIGAIIDNKTDTLVKRVTCNPGCHGENFGAKKGSGYYAYVTSQFSSRLTVLDYDQKNCGKADDAVVAGWVVLADDAAPTDDPIIGNKGMGGQGLMPSPNVYNGGLLAC